MKNILVKSCQVKHLFYLFQKKYSTGKNKQNPLILISNNQNIYFNLSLENFLLCNYNDLPKYLSTYSVETFCQPVLFLWRNKKSVIIGKNQNIWNECNLENIKKDDVLVARRFSGGGAVYHDLGNLCFTFLNSNVNISDNYNIILNGLKKHFNIDATVRGRNDLVVNDKKFSGSAYKKIRNVHLHHGTILINLERSVLNKYLTPDKIKYVKHGVSSVNARTVNLVELNPTVTYEKLCYALIETFLNFYKTKVQEKTDDVENVLKYKEIIEQTGEQTGSTDLIQTSEQLQSKLNIHYIDKNEKIIKNPDFLKYFNLLRDWDWCYGKTPKFQNRISNTFNFGKIEMYFNVSDGIIKEGDIFSDSLDIDLIDKMKDIFNRNIRYTKEGVKQFFNNLKVNDQTALDQITHWIIEQI